KYEKREGSYCRAFSLSLKTPPSLTNVRLLIGRHPCGKGHRLVEGELDARATGDTHVLALAPQVAAESNSTACSHAGNGSRTDGSADDWRERQTEQSSGTGPHRRARNTGSHGGFLAAPVQCSLFILVQR